MFCLQYKSVSVNYSSFFTKQKSAKNVRVSQCGVYYYAASRPRHHNSTSLLQNSFHRVVCEYLTPMGFITYVFLSLRVSVELGLAERFGL